MCKQVEVAFATAEAQLIVSVDLPDGSVMTVQEVITASGIEQKLPDIDLVEMKVGIFSKICQLDAVVRQGDRVEIYRPLQQHPMDARRNRAR